MSTRKRFNGATLLQAWREVRRAWTETGATWLQWGHASSSVESCLSAGLADSRGALQWGHASSSVESARYLGLFCAVYGASMGPRFFKRGEDIGERPRHEQAEASMGPRFFKRGELLLCG